MVVRNATRKRERRSRAGVGLALLGMLSVGACSRSESADLEQQVKEARSAAATAQMALDAWLSGEVPGDYTQPTLKAMREKLDLAADKIERAASEPPARLAITLTPMRRTSDALDQAEKAIGALDHARAAQSSVEARAAATTLSLPVSQNASRKQ
jgi:hypothetical protein